MFYFSFWNIHLKKIIIKIEKKIYIYKCLLQLTFNQQKYIFQKKNKTFKFFDY